MRFRRPRPSMRFRPPPKHRMASLDGTAAPDTARRSIEPEATRPRRKRSTGDSRRYHRAERRQTQTLRVIQEWIAEVAITHPPPPGADCRRTRDGGAIPGGPVGTRERPSSPPRARRARSAPTLTGQALQTADSTDLGSAEGSGYHTAGVLCPSRSPPYTASVGARSAGTCALTVRSPASMTSRIPWPAGRLR